MNHNALARLDAVAQAELVARGELRAVELVDACERRLRALDPLLHAFVTTDFERARERAEGPLSGPLAGVPFAFKDVVAYPGMRFSLGSRLFSANVPAEGSPFTARADAAGLVTVGKTATSELGLLGSTETLLEGVTHNPWDLSLSAAGSSGGAAVAVAAGIVPIAHASDAGGSIRIPASVCGLFGFKPSRGRTVPTGEVSSDFVALVSDGCISRSVRDAALFLSIVEADAPELPRLGYARAKSERRLRIGAWTRTALGGEPDGASRAAFDDAVALCRALGHDVRVVDPPPIDGRALSDAFFAMAGATMHGLRAMMQGALGRPIGPGDLEPFTLALADGSAANPGALPGARAAFAEAARVYVEALERFDAVLTPTLAIEPWRLGWLSPVLSRDELVARTERAVGYTPIHNAAGVPAMSVPLSWAGDGNVPTGAHFAAPRGREDVLLGLAYELEEARPWRDRWPPFSYARLFGG